MVLSEVSKIPCLLKSFNLNATSLFILILENELFFPPAKSKLIENAFQRKNKKPLSPQSDQRPNVSGKFFLFPLSELKGQTKTSRKMGR